jgi:hypothetical protein
MNYFAREIWLTFVLGFYECKTSQFGAVRDVLIFWGPVDWDISGLPERNRWHLWVTMTLMLGIMHVPKPQGLCAFN